MTERNNRVSHSPLGKETEYKSNYDPGLLFSIPRSENREKLGLTPDQRLPFDGVDIWNAYELSWLNPKGKPEVALAQFSIPCDSTNIVESKSFKLYLNSLNQTQFASSASLLETLVSDLSRAFDGKVSVNLLPVTTAIDQLEVSSESFVCIDSLDIEVDTYTHCPELLQMAADASGEYALCSHLLKSNCPVTGQPDWASVFIRYKGREICSASILRYLISYREQQDFHEHCVETIFEDLMRQCQPELLTVYARYTRRGGMDINPFRSNFEAPYGNWRIVRQ